MKFLYLFAFFSCACVTNSHSGVIVSKNKTHGQIFLLEKNLQESLREVERVVDGISTVKSGEALTVLKEDSCWKKKFERNDYSIIVYSNPYAPTDLMEMKVSKIDVSKTYTKECLASAERDIEALNLSSINRLLARYKRENAWKWYDMDIGQVRWLYCDKSQLEKYNESLVTFVHETLHSLRNKECLYLSTTGEMLCYEIPSDAPGGNIALYPRLPLKDQTQIDYFIFLQNVYVVAMKQGPTSLFDELNAYTSTTEMYTKILQNQGKNAIFSGDGKQPAANLTAFMAYTLRYVQALKRDHNALFKKYFAAETQNQKNLLVLLRQAEIAYSNWTKELAVYGVQPSEVETWLFEDYLAEKSKLQFDEGADTAVRP